MDASRSLASERDLGALPYLVRAIERREAPPPDEFARRYVRSRCPVILTGLTDGWRPPEEWTLARMATEYGSARVVAAELADGTLLDDPTTGVVFRRVEVRRFIDSLRRPGSPGHYVMAPVSNFGDALARDYRLPAYCAGAAHLRAKLWIGKGGTVTPVHRDVPNNLHVHLTGRKRWLLFPPRESSRMYPRGLLSGMPNFAHVDPEQPDYTRHPRFRDATVIGGVVGPGEALFIPHGWWHHTRTLDDAVSMNFWWGGKLIYLASLASTAFKRLQGIRQDEWAA